MDPRRPREKTLVHLATALGVVLIAAALATSPLGRSPLVQQRYQVADVAQAEGAAPDAAVAAIDLPTRTGDPLLSFRGIRPAEQSAPVSGAESTSAAVEAVMISPQPTSTPSPTTTPPPTATRTPTSRVTPTAPPAPTATAAPTKTAAPAPTAPAVPPPAATRRVGIQVGHWKNSELPAELASLKGSTGAEGKGWREVDVNLEVAQRVVALLQQGGVQTDLIPATVPSKYKADAFVALHCDANSNTAISGYKLARASWSTIPATDDALLKALSSEYAAAAGLPEHLATITPAMTGYYAFSRNLDHAVAGTTPAVILEMGFLTTASDRQLLTGQPDRIADGIAGGILKFLNR